MNKKIHFAALTFAALGLLTLGLWTAPASAGVVYRWVPDEGQPSNRFGDSYLEFDPSYVRSGHSASQNFCSGSDMSGNPPCEDYFPYRYPIPYEGLLKVRMAPNVTLAALPCEDSRIGNVFGHCDKFADPKDLTLDVAGVFTGAALLANWHLELGAIAEGDFYFNPDIVGDGWAHYKDGFLWSMGSASGYSASGKFVRDESTMVPEPYSSSLLGLSLAGLAFTRRRKQ